MEKYCISLYKSGKFYNAFGDNAIIIHYLMGYKYVEYKKSAGFPEAAYNKVINKLQEEKVSYCVYEKEEIIDSYKGIGKNYQILLKESLKRLEMEQRINRLKERIEDFTVEDLERVIEGLENVRTGEK